MSTDHPHRGRTGLDRIRRAAGHSARGLRDAYRTESAFRQEVWLAAVMLLAAPWLGRDWVEVSLLAGSVMIVLVVELLNSAVEKTIDRISLDLHDLSRLAKDLGSAAVLLALLTCGFVWAAALWHRFGA